MTIEQLKALPKAELHCHLDGSLSREFMESQLGRRVQPEELSVSDDCTSLAEYLEKFSLPGQCIMDEKGLEAEKSEISYRLLPLPHFFCLAHMKSYIKIKIAPRISAKNYLYFNIQVSY